MLLFQTSYLIRNRRYPDVFQYKRREARVRKNQVQTLCFPRSLAIERIWEQLLPHCHDVKSMEIMLKTYIIT